VEPGGAGRVEKPNHRCESETTSDMVSDLLLVIREVDEAGYSFAGRSLAYRTLRSGGARMRSNTGRKTLVQ
jgi:hypothetical protein